MEASMCALLAYSWAPVRFRHLHLAVNAGTASRAGLKVHGLIPSVQALLYLVGSPTNPFVLIRNTPQPLITSMAPIYRLP